ncbi:MAG: hypothetical protein FWC42_10160 [Proteobacteria bacterium]|nr:hypothetical protein [Pseudomonadota bacterium]
MLAAHWKNEEAPLFNGLNSLACSSGKIFSFEHNRLVSLAASDDCEWVSVGVLATRNLYGGEYVVKCGEAFAHGSVGIIVLESLASGEPIWSFASSETNPFDQIEIKGSRVLVLSTSGAVLRFRPPLKDVAFLRPGIAFNLDDVTVGSLGR